MNMLLLLGFVSAIVIISVVFSWVCYKAFPEKINKEFYLDNKR